LGESSPPIVLRPAVAADAPLLHAWRTDPGDAACYFSAEPISLERHRAWLREKLASPGTRIYLACEGDSAAAVVRFDVTAPGEAEVAIAVDRARRGRGIGRATLEAAIPCAARELGFALAVAVIRPENAASLRLFARAGFFEDGPAERLGLPARRLVRRVERGD
jgi:RimJ/RimL family protein N-acetyltransferase